MTRWLDDEVYPRLSHETVFGDLKGFRRSGPGRFVALCPAHDDHHPSFSMREGWPTGHCFSCGHTRSWWAHIAARVGGGRAVLDELAHLAGIQPLRRLSPEAEAAERRRRETEELRETFAADALAALGKPEGADVLSYLLARGYHEDECRQAGLGAWPAGDRDRVTLLGLDYDAAGRSHRLVVCLRDPAGRLAGFALRALGDPPRGTGKYLYSRALDKSSLVPGLHLARKLPGPVVLVEGVVDAAMLGVRGLSIAALGGSRLTEGQAIALRRAGVSAVVLSLDEDQAGREGTETGAIMLLRQGVAVGVAPQLPGCKDPDEMVRAHGIDAYRSLVSQHVSGGRWIVRRILEARDTQVERDALAAEVLAAAATMPPVAEQEMVAEVGVALSLDAAGLRAALRRHAAAQAEQGIRRACADAAAALLRMAKGEQGDVDPEAILQSALQAVRRSVPDGGTPADVPAARVALSRRTTLPRIPWCAALEDSPIAIVAPDVTLRRTLHASILSAWLDAGHPVCCVSQEPADVVVGRCVAALASAQAHAAGSAPYSFRDVIVAGRDGGAEIPILDAWERMEDLGRLLRFGDPRKDMAVVADTWRQLFEWHRGPVCVVAADAPGSIARVTVEQQLDGSLQCSCGRNRWSMTVEGGLILLS